MAVITTANMTFQVAFGNDKAAGGETVAKSKNGLFQFS
jgi:hypothetical protein